ncbi:MAG: PDZ domain-containing protein [Variovorax sp.]|nr:MAG: PDZ domain-containing protein [Variovorax sp.]
MPGCAPMQSLNASDFSALARSNGPAVVNISVAREAGDRALQGARAAPGGDRLDDGTLGSGFIVSADGYILTNAHVVARGAQINVRLTDRREFKARLVGIDPLADIALLKIDAAGLPTVKIGNPADTDVGDWALAIGSPYGFSNSVTAGIVSAKGRVLPGAHAMPFLQTDVPVNPGNSGGPLFNLRGEVIGINSRIYSSSGGYQGLSFAIPIDVAMRIRQQLQEKGSVTRARIGMAVQEVSQALADSFRLPRPAGALVSYVQPGGAASRAGLKPGDVILQVNGADVLQSADALGLIADMTPGETARLSLWRDRAPTVIAVVVEALHATPAVPLPMADPAPPFGLVVRPLLPQERQVLRIEGGLLVQRVNAAALRAGVQAGDVILALNGQPVASLEALAAEAKSADGAVALLVQRGPSRLFIPVDVGRPSQREPQGSRADGQGD